MHVIFAHLGVPKSYLDVGCYHGFLVRAARMFGCNPSLGLTSSIEVKREAKRYAALLVKAARDTQGEFDLVTCLEGLDSSVAHLVSPSGYVVIRVPFTNEKGAIKVENGLQYDHDKTWDLQHAWERAGLEPLPLEVQVFTRA
jgi:2-polyprenyl-3-methyl-5-hydroxy-6-metoxy-1,4-benzoquinol methylase